MLSREKIRLMSSLAIYHKNGGAEELGIAQHYRFDYLQSQLFSSAIRYTFCYILGIAAYTLADTNGIFSRINENGFAETIRYFGLWYLAGLVGYLLIAFFVYDERYRRAEENMEIYASGLKRLRRKFASGKHTK